VTIGAPNGSNDGVASNIIRGVREGSEARAAVSPMLRRSAPAKPLMKPALFGASRFPLVYIMRTLSGKWIFHAHSSWRVMGDIACNDFKIVNQRRRSDLFVEWILGIGDAKTAPNVRCLLVKRKDSICVCGRHSQQPLLEPLRLRLIATMANSLDPLSELADRYRRKVKLGPFLTSSGKECSHARVALVPLAGLADHIGIDQVHVSVCGRLVRARNPRPCPRPAC